MARKMRTMCTALHGGGAHTRRTAQDCGYGMPPRHTMRRPNPCGSGTMNSYTCVARALRERGSAAMEWPRLVGLCGVCAKQKRRHSETPLHGPVIVSRSHRRAVRPRQASRRMDIMHEPGGAGSRQSESRTMAQAPQEGKGALHSVTLANVWGPRHAALQTARNPPAPPPPPRHRSAFLRPLSNN